MSKSLLFLFTFLLLLNISARASHVSGADLTFQCIGNGSYILTYTFYRDCFGIPAPTQVTAEIENSCGFPPLTFLLTLMSPPVIISPLCPGEISTCNGGTIPGIEKCIYQGTITVGGLCQ